MSNATIGPFTSRTRVALAISRAIAASRGETDVTATHIVLGILWEGKSVAVAGLTHEGINLNILNAQLDTSLGHPSGRTEPRRVALDATAGEEEIVRLGEKEAEARTDEFLGTEHLLLAILRESASEAAELMAAQGITVQRLETGMMTARRGPPA